MEDFVLIKNDFLKLENHNISLFAIFDGHGGAHVSQYLKNNFCDVLTKIIQEKSNVELIDNIRTAIETIDKDLEKLNDDAKECGSTGTIVVIDNDILYCVNVGDSKCFYIDDQKAVQMTEDHNCKNELEVNTIKQRGALVFNGRVFGALCLTRTFGDTDFKEFGVICEPFINKISINNIKYIVIASDGVWDFVDDKQLFKIGSELKKDNSEEFCNNLVEYALKGGSHDNISCIVLKFGN
jgi:protein phosphatase 1L